MRRRTWAVVAMVGLAAACGAGSRSVAPSTSSTGAVGAAPANGGRYVPPSPAPTASCHSRGGLPDPACTPGATDPTVTAATLGTTVCRPGGGYSASVRPPVAVTEPIKRERMRAYGEAGLPLGSVELDHAESGVERLTGNVLAGQIVSDASVRACPS